jgi:hypothetical protein
VEEGQGFWKKYYPPPTGWRFFSKPDGKLKRSGSVDLYPSGTGQYLCEGKLNEKK